ncbi:MAG TPA: type VI secretion system-associated FHA domain protein [Aquabacterium sp.]|nr:type VI secretion system-associated FHA domain protein [Aquabacterium sp.]
MNGESAAAAVLELRIQGPSFEVVRMLKAADPELVLGRDADCAICLPDPQRNISRRHLAVWNHAGELHFRVLSVVNGVEMPFGEAPPGARGVLPCGQVLKLAEYQLTVDTVAAQEQDADPWAVFDREGSGIAPVPEAARTAVADEDPFGDWGFETTFGPGGAHGGGLQASKLGVAPDVAAFYRGLGLDPKQVGPLSEGELEAVGQLVRTAVAAVLQVRQAAAAAAQDLRAEDRTMIGTRESHPLNSGHPLEAKLQYLFGGRAASSGFIAPGRALQELVNEVLAHEQALGVAARAAIEGTLNEFAPGELKARLLGGGSKLFEAARAWDAYARYYAEQGEQMPQWVQRMLDRHFTDAYLRESHRIKRETAGRQR